MPEMQTLLTGDRITKRYGAMAAVKELTFEVRRGEVLGIGGPNGAGKTTLFDMISGVSRPTEGSVRFEGRDLAGLSPSAICHLGIARTFQLNAVFDSMTVRQNLMCSAYFGTRNRVVPSLRFDAAAREQTDEALEICGLADQADTPATSLSILNRKLLMLASAIATKPKLLLLDEPVGGLNAKEIDQCAVVFRKLRDSHAMTIVVIEHVMSFMTAIADRVLILHHGSKLYEGTAAGLAQDRDVIEVYLGASGAEAVRAAQQQGADHAAS
ncbi:MAG: ABC transporter ATP-binding protein [Rhizobiaceae bacterium]